MRRLLVFLFAVPLGLPLDALAAYAQTTPVYEHYDAQEGSRNRCTVVRYTETDVAAASEASVDVGWRFGYILSLQQLKESGDAATLHTAFGRDAGWTASTMGQVGGATGTLAYLHEQGAVVFHLRTTKKLFIRATPASGTNNVVHTELIVCRGAP